MAQCTSGSRGRSSTASPVWSHAGSLGAVEIVADKATKKSFDVKAGAGALVNKAAAEHGLIVRNIGDNIAFTPPLIITETQVDELFDKMKLALDDGLAALRKAEAA